MVSARKIIAEGCEKCPNSEDVWFHAAELNTPENAKIILGKAVQHVPQSVKIWLKAAELESDVNAKKRVLRKGESVPCGQADFKRSSLCPTRSDYGRRLSI